MNFTLHKHNRPDHQIALPNGLCELMTDISREVLREQPKKITEFVANYLDALLVVRENTYIAKQTLDDLIQFDMDMLELMKSCGMSEVDAKAAAKYLRNELQSFTEMGCVTEFNEKIIISQLITTFALNGAKAFKVKKIIEDSFKAYFYRYISYRDAKHGLFGVTWKDAIERTLDVYRKCKPEQSAMDRAAIVIQSTYRGFYQRKRTLNLKKRENAAIVIQSHFRGHQTRQLLAKKFTVSNLISRTIIPIRRSKSGGIIPPFTSFNVSRNSEA